MGSRASLRRCNRLTRRCFCSSGWPSNTWGETDRHEGWAGSNWAGNVRWADSTLCEPLSEEHLSEIVHTSSKVSIVGSAHSFTPVVAANGCATTLVSLRKMPRICHLDEQTCTLTVDAGCTYSEICSFLSTTQFALPNTASLPHFSVAGALATGTHGSSGMGPDGRLLLSGLADTVVKLKVGIGPQCRPCQQVVTNSVPLSLRLSGLMGSLGVWHRETLASTAL